MDGRNKRKIKSKRITLVLATALMFTMCFGGFETAEAKRKDKVSDVLMSTGDYIYSVVTEPCYGPVGGEWAVYGLKEAGYPVSENYFKIYKKSVEKAVKEGYRGKPGVLHDKKYTEYSRVIFTYGSLGFKPDKVGGCNLLKKLADYDKVVWQGINGPVWALRALDSGKYEIPKAPKGTKQATRELYIEAILSAQLKDGGWDISGKSADPDMTAMALQALAPYKQKKNVSKAIDKGIKCLSKLQKDDGGYCSWDTPNCESCAQVLLALSLLGIDGDNDERFIKNGKTVLDALLSYYDKDTGGFRHVNEAGQGYDNSVNQMATEQAYYSLANYKNKIMNSSNTKKTTKTKKS